MANIGSGSPLANVAARARAVQRTRSTLGISGSAPNGPVRPATPPPSTPAASDPAASLPQTDFAPPAGTDPNSREAMLDQARQFLSQAANGGNQVAPAPSPIDVPAEMPAPDLGESLMNVGATNLPLDIQFQRMAGRPPSGRELAVFASYSQLYQQLGRPPTRNELLYRVVEAGGGHPGESGTEPVVM